MTSTRDSKAKEEKRVLAEHCSIDSNNSSIDVEKETDVASISWRYKIPILIVLLLLNLGPHVAEATLSPLKTTIKENVKEHGEKICNARYGVISSASALINALFPIISGVLIDFYGPSFVSLTCSTITFVGYIVRAVGGQRESFSIILGGEILSGFGFITLNSCKYKLYTHWFSGSVKSGPGHIAFIIGLDIAMNRVYNTIGKQSAIPIVEDAGEANWYWALWFGAILTGFSLIINVAYVIMERRLPSALRVKTGYEIASERCKTLQNVNKHWAILQMLKEQLKQVVYIIRDLPAAYWLICCTQILQSASIDAYSSNSPELIQNTRGEDKRVAAAEGGLDDVIPIVLTPVFGFLIDRYGGRTYYIVYTACVYLIAFSLLAYTKVNALAPVLLASLALSSNDLPFEVTIPLVVRTKTSLGTAFGGWKAFYKAGTVILDVSTGAIQNHSVAVKHVSPEHQFDDMFYFLIAIKCVDVINGCMYMYVDKHYMGHVMTLSERGRVTKEANEESRKKDRKLLKPRLRWTIVGICMYFALVITAYVIFIYYSVAKETCR
ncbi:hypothetical protein MVES1_004016 [Malassezia vespertilionis]|uniref:Lysosomal dipeptide transporter MFSD1 n=1 Tax=Malassezia vespertilionis TaxID=2020962 RepID=A0A2N1J7H6_9BASI|nr:uncharacterized protein MVES1_004016 [Malassezia vespertilionis]PKI82517.1 hypothetical protein MVES_003565 [Malassezia vespertilionis]WFD08639.1 hypothetical protein MVES1_004016 [Malassezia vespertilionis]